MLCDDRSVCCVQRNTASMALLLVLVLAFLALACALPFATGVVRYVDRPSPPQEDAPASPPAPAPPPDGVDMRAVLAIALVANAACGFCIAAFSLCVWGDADGSCAFRGSEKRVAWCFSLSMLGLLGVCVAFVCVWRPDSEEVFCVPPNKRETYGKAPAGRPHTLHRAVTSAALGGTASRPHTLHRAATSAAVGGTYSSKLPVGKVGGNAQRSSMCTSNI